MAGDTNSTNTSQRPESVYRTRRYSAVGGFLNGAGLVVAKTSEGKCRDEMEVDVAGFMEHRGIKVSQRSELPSVTLL